MSQRDNFLGGFFLGTVIGGAVGGVLGVVLATRRTKALETQSDEVLESANQNGIVGADNIEITRRRLEDKIAQLNGAIDDVRHQLASVNNLSIETQEDSQN
ncbi:MAG: hypothetical protein VKJ02_19600 [Snowella sp.]|nr:hypothetical protein [Snowella sp.]